LNGVEGGYDRTYSYGKPRNAHPFFLRPGWIGISDHSVDHYAVGVILLSVYFCDLEIARPNMQSEESIAEFFERASDYYGVDPLYTRRVQVIKQFFMDSLMWSDAINPSNADDCTDVIFGTLRQLTL
jgi:hypothetical protein